MCFNLNLNNQSTLLSIQEIKEKKSGVSICFDLFRLDDRPINILTLSPNRRPMILTVLAFSMTPVAKMKEQNEGGLKGK